MDKAQKELLDTYFRKRNIAAEQGGKIELYEINDYSIKNYKFFDDELNELKKLDGNEIAKILLLQPQLFNYFKDDFDKINLHVNNRYGNLESVNQIFIYQLILHQPQSIEYLKDYIDVLSTLQVSEILKKHPQLKNYFDKWKPSSGYDF